jgi:hypothetical protein
VTLAKNWIVARFLLETFQARVEFPQVEQKFRLKSRSHECPETDAFLDREEQCLRAFQWTPHLLRMEPDQSMTRWWQAVHFRAGANPQSVVEVYRLSD